MTCKRVAPAMSNHPPSGSGPAWSTEAMSRLAMPVCQLRDDRCGSGAGRLPWIRAAPTTSADRRRHLPRHIAREPRSDDLWRSHGQGVLVRALLANRLRVWMVVPRVLPDDESLPSPRRDARGEHLRRDAVAELRACAVVQLALRLSRSSVSGPLPLGARRRRRPFPRALALRRPQSRSRRTCAHARTTGRGAAMRRRPAP
jgi:hypothetical protein